MRRNLRRILAVATEHLPFKRSVSILARQSAVVYTEAHDETALD